MEKQAEETFLEQVKKTLGGYRDQVSDFWNDTHASAAMDRSGEFLKNWAVPAGVTTLGAGALAGSLTAQGERPGETKRERTIRILRNAAIASGATGLGWAGAAGVAGLEPATDLPSGTSMLDKIEEGDSAEDAVSILKRKNQKELAGKTLASALTGGAAGLTIPWAATKSVGGTKEWLGDIAEQRKQRGLTGGGHPKTPSLGKSFINARGPRVTGSRLAWPAAIAGFGTATTGSPVWEWPGNVMDFLTEDTQNETANE